MDSKRYNFRVSRPIDAVVPAQVLADDDARRKFAVDEKFAMATVDAWLASEAELCVAQADTGAGFGRRDMEWVLEDWDDVVRRQALVMKGAAGSVPDLEVGVSLWDPPEGE